MDINGRLRGDFCVFFRRHVIPWIEVKYDRGRLRNWDWVQTGRELKSVDANDSIGEIVVIVQANAILGHSLKAELSLHPTGAPKGHLQSQIAIRTVKRSAKSEYEPSPCQSA
jgi:hypothetical protein